MQHRPGKAPIAAIVATGLVAGAVTVGVLVAPYFQATMNAPRWLSEDTDVYVALTPNVQTLASLPLLKRFYDAAQRSPDAPAAPEAPGSLEHQVEKSLGVSLDDDVFSWVGLEAGLALEGLDAASAMSGQTGYMWLLAARDEAKARAFLAKLRERHEGVTAKAYRQVEVHASRDGAYLDAFADGYVLISNNRQMLEGALERRQTKAATLADSERFKRVSSALPNAALGYAYLSGRWMAPAMELAMATQPESNRAVLDPVVRNVEAFQASGLALSVVGDGLELQSASYFDVDKLSPDYAATLRDASKPLDPAVLHSVSGEAIAFSAFNLPAAFKDHLSRAVADSPEALQFSQMLERETGIELQRDLLGWFTGDTSFVMLPGPSSAQPVSGYFVLRPSDEKAARSGVKRLGDALERSLAGSRGPSLRQHEANGAAFKLMTSPRGGPSLGFGFAGANLVVGLGERELTQASAGQPASILKDVVFQHASARLPQPYGSVAYLDVKRALKTYRQTLKTTAERRAFDESPFLQALQPVQAIAAAATPGIDAEGLAVGKLFIDAAAE